MSPPASKPSIRNRITAALSLVYLVWALGLAASLWLVVRHEVDELLDNTLEESAQILHGLLSFDAERLRKAGPGALPAPPHQEQLIWQIVDGKNVVLLRSHQAPERSLSDRPLVEGEFFNAAAGWRSYAMRFDAEGHWLLVAQTQEERREARLDAFLMVGGTVMVVGALCAAWLRRKLARELRPIDRLSKEIAHFDPAFATARLPEPSRAELMPMHAAVVDLGARLSQHQANERAFVAHAAHALRTPLAGIVAQLAAAKQRCGPEAMPFLEQSSAAASRLRQVISTLLTMFRSGGDVDRQEIDMRALVAPLPLGQLELIVHEDCRAIADQDLLSAALINLLDNSVRHGASHVLISVAESARGFCIKVVDDGHGVDAQRLGALQLALEQRAYDAELGLGLTLSDLVCRAHGGRLEVLAAQRGFAVALHLSLPGLGGEPGDEPRKS